MRILVTAIRPSKQSVQPPGIHLRWTLPSESERMKPSLFASLRQKLMGFPEKGFDISRRKHNLLKPTKLPIPHIEKNDTPKKISLPNQAILFPDPTTRLLTDGDRLTVLEGGRLLIRFLKPVVFCEIAFTGANDENEINAYRGRNHLTSNQTAVSSGRLSVMGAYFDHVLVTLNFERLKQFSFVTEEDYCNAPDWVSVAQLDHLYPGQLDDALKRLEQGLQNRYATSQQSAIKKYSPHVEALLIQLNSILETNVDATLTPEDHIGTCPDGVHVSELSTRNLLLSIASDPNLAKIMGLYWVDRFGARTSPKIGKNYDYKIEGQYGGKPICGLAINVGKEEAPLPTVPDLTSVEQLPGFRWNNRDPLARVGLNWMKPRSFDPTSTIFYDVYRQIQDKEKLTRLTENKPVPAQPNGKPGNGQTSSLIPCFVDQDIPLGAYIYQISGIDIFGQESKNSESRPVKIVDQSPPPPPVHLRCSVVQPGYPWRDPEHLAIQIAQNNLDINTAQIRMSLEYGHAQHRQAPDATHVILYWRQDSLRINRMAKVIQVLSRSVGNGLFSLKVKLDSIDERELKLFDGGVLSVKTRQGQDLPNSQRAPTRIERIESNQIVLRPSTIQLLAEDECELTSDVHNRENWHPFGEKIELRKPLQGSVAEIRDLPVHVGGKHGITSQDAASAAGIANALPGDLRPEDTAGLAPVTELLIDRELLESDLFSDGLLIANGNKSVPIIYSTAGIAYASQSNIPPSMISRIGIAASNSVDFNQTIRLASPEKFDMYGDPVRFIVKEVIISVPPTEFELQSSGGEVVFEWEQEHCGQKEIAAVTARVVSSAHKQEGDKTSLLIKLRKADWDSYGRTGFLVDKTTASYYAPYLVQPFSASIARNGDSPGVPGWRWSSESGVLKGYIAATAADDRSNEGPLSHPIEASAFKPPPTGKPNPPVPCVVGDNQQDVDRWYASPPDFDGDATVCLQWNPDGIDPADGLRCEMARALDATIIEADKKNWLLGLHEPGFVPVEIDILSVRDPNAADGDLPADVVVVQFEPENNIADESIFVDGVFVQNDVRFRLTEHTLTKTVAGNEVTFEASVQPLADAILNTAVNATFWRGGIVADQGTSFEIGTPETALHNGQVLLTIDPPGELDLSDPVVQTGLVGGRLSTASGSSTNYFKISKISLDRDADHNLTDRVSLLLQPQVGNRNQIGNQVTIRRTPSYDLVKPSDALLRELADKPWNISAFGVVTGTPVKSASNKYYFRDQFPGIGSNRYFYKARDIDSSENNTRWSETSIPFFQVDTSSPEAPSNFHAVGGNRYALLTWQRTDNRDIVGFEIFRESDPASLKRMSSSQLPVVKVVIDPSDSQPQASTGSLRIINGVVDLKSPDGEFVPQIASANGSGISGVLKVQSDGQIDDSVNYLLRNLTELDGRIIRYINPVLPAGTSVVVEMLAIREFLISRRVDNKEKLFVQDNILDPGYPYEISHLLGVFEAEEFDYSVRPHQSQAITNHASNLSLLDDGRIAGFADAMEGRVFILVVRGNKPEVIGRAETMERQLFFRNGMIDLRFPNNIKNVLAVYDGLEFDASQLPITQQTATNYFIQGSTFEPIIGRVSGLDQSGGDGPTVALVEFENEDGSVSVHVVSRKYFADLPLVKTGDKLEFDIDWAYQQVVGIFRRDEYDFNLSPGQQKATNYLVAEKSWFDSANHQLYANPLLPSLTEVAVEIMPESTTSNSNGPVYLKSMRDRWEFIHSVANVTPQTAEFYYAVRAIKSVQINQSGDRLDVVSPLSPAVRVNIFDHMPPTPPLWQRVLWWDELQGQAADQQSDVPAILLEWSTPFPVNEITVQRKDGNYWKAIGSGVSLDDPGDNIYRFRFIDRTATPSRDYAYRLAVVNGFGVRNTVFDEIPIAKLKA